MAKRRVGRYPRAFRQMAVDRLRRCENVVVLSEELGVHRRLLYKWRKQLEPAEGSAQPPPDLREFTLGKEINQLKRLLAEKTQELDFQRCLAKSRGSTPEERGRWREGIYDQIREVMSMQGNLSVERMCSLVQVSRASFYRSLKSREP